MYILYNNKIIELINVKMKKVFIILSVTIFCSVYLYIQYIENYK